MRTTLALLALLAAAPAAAVPLTFGHQGRLLDATGVPLDGERTLTVTLYDASAGGEDLWTEQHTTTVDDGYFAIRLGAIEPLDAALLAGDRWIGLSIDGEPELAPRMRLDSVPFAVHALQAERADNADHATSAASATSATTADHATSADTAAKADSATNADHATSADSATRADVADALAEGANAELGSVVVGGTTVIASDGTVGWDRISGAPVQLEDLGCATSDEVPVFDGVSWGCGPLPAPGVTSVTAGDGLAGGTVTDEGTLSIAPDGVTAAMLAEDTDALAKLTGGALQVTTHGGLRIGNSIYNAWSGSLPGSFETDGDGYSDGPMQIKTALRCDNGNGLGYMWHLEFIGHEFQQDRPFRTVSVGYSQSHYPAEVQDVGSFVDYGDLGVTPYCSSADEEGAKFLSFELTLNRRWHASDLVINVLHGRSSYQKTFSDGFEVTGTREGDRY